MNWDDIVIKCDGKKEYNNKGLMKNMNRKYECEHCGHKPEDGSTVEVKNNKYKCGDCGHFTSFSFGCKDTVDQKIKQTTGKAPMANLLEFNLALEEVVKVRQYGKDKYPDALSWRQVPDEEFDNAVLRHIFNSDKIDKESKFRHKAHAIMNLLFQLQKEMEEA